MENEEFIAKVLKINPDIIYTSPSKRTIQTSEKVAEIMETYRNKKIKIEKDERLRTGENSDTKGIYKEILKK
jgi:broad specificity phosphatase PhoE